MKRITYILVAGLTLAALALLAGCEEKPPLVAEQTDSTRDTSYVQVIPSFSSYVGAEDILIGRDELLYVADTRANRVVMLNRAGQLLSARTILHPRSLAQDTRLDLLVGGEILVANGDTVGSIFRLHLVSNSPDSAHRLDLARMDTVWRELARPNRRFPGITVFGDNTYLAVRTAVPFPDNSSFIDPDARVLQFNNHDVFITPVPAFTSGSSSIAGGITTIYQPTAIASFPRVRDFVLSQSSADSTVAIQYGALWMRFELTNDFEGWLPKYDPARPEDRSVDFIRSYRYRSPEAVAIDPIRQDVFVADAALDSVFKFNSRGRIKSESFGFVRSGRVMTRPTGLAFFEKVLYVLDANSGLVLRFRLTTDIPRQ
jgi:hypothetical protein